MTRCLFFSWTTAALAWVQAFASAAALGQVGEGLSTIQPPDGLAADAVMTAPWEGSPVGLPAEAQSHLGRHIGLGEPLVATSWMNRPYHVGWWIGMLSGDSLIDGFVERDMGMIGGYRVGCDLDHYWGAEIRFGFAYPTIYDTDDSDTDALDSRRSSSERYADVSLTYYPWGDSRYRPFLLAGVGLSDYRFSDHEQLGLSETLWSFPLGGGVKYLYRPWLALRLTAINDWAPNARNMSGMHNLTVTGDVEVHFGGSRTSYFPYHGSIHLW